MASLFEWKDSFSVNIKESDEQHKMLVGMLNELFDAMLAREANEVISGILKGMQDYVGVHFSYEEHLMQKHLFPGYPAHKKEHDEFKAKVGDFIQKHAEGKMMLSLEVMNFLKDWLKNHIQGTDKAYGPFLNEKGVK